MARVSNIKKPILRLVKNQLTSLVINERLVTTQSKAKILKHEAQALISLLTTPTDLVNLRRKLNNILYGKAIDKVLEEGKFYKSVSIYKTKKRAGDSAMMSIVSLNMSKPEKQANKKG